MRRPPGLRTGLIPVGGKDKILFFLRSVTLVTADASVVHQPLGGAVSAESFKSPTASGGESLFILVHDTDQFAGTFRQGKPRVFGLKQIKHQYLPVFEIAGFESLFSLRVGVDVMDALERVFQRVTLLNDHGLKMRPLAVPFRIRDLSGMVPRPSQKILRFQPVC